MFRITQRGPQLSETQLTNYQASIKANIAIALTFLEIARIEGKGRDIAKEQAERTAEAVHRLLPVIEDLLETADREWIRTSLVELESALTTFNFPRAPES